VHADLLSSHTGGHELVLAGHADDDHIRKRPLVSDSDDYDAYVRMRRLDGTAIFGLSSS
jgi:hypothetical protein